MRLVHISHSSHKSFNTPFSFCFTTSRSRGRNCAQPSEIVLLEGSMQKSIPIPGSTVEVFLTGSHCKNGRLCLSNSVVRFKAKSYAIFIRCANIPALQTNWNVSICSTCRPFFCKRIKRLFFPCFPFCSGNIMLVLVLSIVLAVPWFRLMLYSTKSILQF